MSEVRTLMCVMLIVKAMVTVHSCSFDNSRLVKFPGDINIAVFLDIHEKGNSEGCGKVNPSAVQEMEAFRLVFEQLNEERYIPEVKLGLLVYDTCARSDIAAENLRHLISTVDEKYSNDTCKTADTEFIFGIAGPSTSEEAIAISRMLAAEDPDDRLVQISHSATATVLTANSEFSNAFSITPPDSLQSKVIVETLKKLGWNYVALVYSDDTYGRQGASGIIQLSNSSGICLAFIEKISFDRVRTELSDALNRISAITPNTRSAAQGIVFFGDSQIAKELLDLSAGSRNIEFIFSDYVEFRQDIFSNYANVAAGALVIVPSFEKIQMLQNYTTELYDNATFLQERANGNRWLEELYGQIANCQGLASATSCLAVLKEQLTTQSVYSYYAIQLAYVYAKLIKTTYHAICQDSKVDICSSLRQMSRTEILKNLLSFSVSYHADFRNAPMELRDGTILFSLNGSRTSSENLPDLYDVTSYNKNCTGGISTFCFNKVGSYRGNVLSLDVDKVKSYSKEQIEIPRVAAVCKPGDICESCLRLDSSKHWVYVPGDVLIVGLVPVYDPGNYPFTCADIRLEKGFQLVEAILFAVQKINTKEGVFGNVFPGKTIGVLIMNTCYSETVSQRATYSVFSGKDAYLPSGVADLGSKVMGFVGSVKSDVSEDVASVLTNMKVVQVAYGSTAVSLSDRHEYPYFMRTCASDERQGEILVMLMKKMGWTYFSIVYVDDSYGQNGLKVIKRFLRPEKLCIAQEIRIEASGSSNYYSVLEKLRTTPSARVVILFLRSSKVKKMLEDLSNTGRHNYRVGEFIFVLTESVGDRLSVIADSSAAEGSISLLQEVPSNAEFNQYLSQKKVDTPDLPEWLWLEEYWEKYLLCYRDKSFNKSLSTKSCSRDSTITADPKYFQDPWTPFAINAVYSLVLGASEAAFEVCKGYTLCENFRSNPDIVREKILKTRLDLFGTGFLISAFDENGDGTVGFKVFNVQKDGSVRFFKEVGRWNKGEKLILQEDKMKFPDDEVPVSVCPNEKECNMCRQSNATCLEYESSGWKQTMFLGLIGSLGAAVALLLGILVILCSKLYCRANSESRRHPDFQSDLDSNADSLRRTNFRVELDYLNPIRDTDVYCTISDRTPRQSGLVHQPVASGNLEETTSDSGKGTSSSGESRNERNGDKPPAVCPQSRVQNPKLVKQSGHA